jgi:hypothetical protein
LRDAVDFLAQRTQLGFGFSRRGSARQATP